MAAGSTGTAVLLETRPILPIAQKFALPNSIIWKLYEDNYTLCRIFLDSDAQCLEYSGAPVK
jgi:hypothetical protein